MLGTHTHIHTQRNTHIQSAVESDAKLHPASLAANQTTKIITISLYHHLKRFMYF